MIKYLWILLLPLALQSQYKNIEVSREFTDDAEEVSIAVDPENPNRLVAGANINYFWYSDDGGLSWTQSRLTSQTYGVWGDPCLLFNEYGEILFAHLSNPPMGEWIDRIVVQTSEDKGKSWTQGAGIGLRKHHTTESYRAQDKEWMVVDRTDSEYSGNVYIAWTEFDKYDSKDDSDSSRIRFSYSEDGGAIWSYPVVVSDTSGDALDGDNTTEGSVPTVGPDGQVYVAWAFDEKIYFDKSLDGGKSWGEDIFVAEQKAGWVQEIPGVFRCNGLPVTKCDISNSPSRGTIYVNWTDQPDSENNTDVFIAKSTDEGESWSEPIKVNQDNSGKHQFFTWMDIDQKTGYIYVIYYDRRNYFDENTDVYMSVSGDGGKTFKDVKISQEPFKPSSLVFMGDYIGIAAHNGRINPIWTRMDGDRMSIWTALIEEETLNSERAKDYLKQAYPNPFHLSTVIPYSVESPSGAELKIFNNYGTQIYKTSLSEVTNGHHFYEWIPDKTISKGKYYYTLTTKNKTYTGSVIYMD